MHAVEEVLYSEVQDLGISKSQNAHLPKGLSLTRATVHVTGPPTCRLLRIMLSNLQRQHRHYGNAVRRRRTVTDD
jgi:hypothetical protein